MAERIMVSARRTALVPRTVLDEAKLKPGQPLVAIVRRGQIVLVPVRPIEELRGAAPDINISNYRDEED